MHTADIAGLASYQGPLGVSNTGQSHIHLVPQWLLSLLRLAVSSGVCGMCGMLHCVLYTGPLTSMEQQPS